MYVSGWNKYIYIFLKGIMWLKARGKKYTSARNWVASYVSAGMQYEWQL